jgi:acyl-CoA synthetase (AMP-forming)/AMP-acid ligase II
MLLQRLNTWAATQPDRAALIEGDASTSYAQFARMIEAVRVQLEAKHLPAGQFAVVLARTATERWVTSLALGAIGVHVVNPSTLHQAADLRMKNLACIAATQEVAAQIKALPTSFGDARLISIPQTLYDRDRFSAGPLPSPAAGTKPTGGYVVLTSGTTGSFKKVLFDTTLEEKLLLWSADVGAYDRNTVFHLSGSREGAS